MIVYNNIESGLTEVYLGDNSISEVYIGDEKVFPSGEPTPSYPYTFYRVSRGGSGYTVECSASSADTITSAQTASGLSTSELSSKTATETPVEVIIGDCCKTIGSGACSGWTQLTSITISNNVENINYEAFYDCIKLRNLNIPNSVTSIEGYAFCNCMSLTSLTISNNVTNIGRNAFYGCSDLTSLTIPDSVTNIGTNAFYQGTKLISINIGSGITSIGNNAFANGLRLNSITIKALTPPSLGSFVFENTNDCPFFVPAESLEAYKTATNWSAYANRIQAIQT